VRKPADDAAPESDRYEDAPHPRETTELYGHAAAEAAFLEAYQGGRLPQAWLIGGREGVGKATLAWRVARFLLAHPDPMSAAARAATSLHVPPDHPAARRIAALSSPDVGVLRREWDAKTKKHFTEIRVADVRGIIDMFHHSAGEGGWRVAIIDCADDLNRSSANALLKLIEEPPPRSLFMLVSHRPAQVLPTIRSRCRKLQLQPLADADVAAALAAMDAAIGPLDAQARAAAAERAGGSVRDALKLLGGGSLNLLGKIEGVLRNLPAVDWRRVHELADGSQGREGAETFETLLTSVYDWIDAAVRDAALAAPGAGQGAARRLAPLAEVWEKIAASARETEALNLDRQPLVLSIFADLSDAVRATRN
jgi:DNA polymerase-3 subunit delta'